MTADPQWTIDDLVTRYYLEPALRDVFVEGYFDQDVLQACLRSAGDDERVCYPIDSVELPNCMLERYDLTEGNKQRVMALALELDAAVEDASCKCLVDSDLDLWITSTLTTPYLVRTKFTSLDLYFFTEELLKRLLLTVGKAKIHDWTQFFESAVSVLKDLYALKLADCELGLCLRWTNWEKCLEKKSSSIEIDVVDYATRVLLANKRGRDAEAFIKSFRDWRGKLTIDPRLCIRGHDFVEIVSWAIGKFGGKKEFATPDAIEGALLLVAENATEVLDELH